MSYFTEVTAAEYHDFVLKMMDKHGSKDVRQKAVQNGTDIPYVVTSFKKEEVAAQRFTTCEEESRGVFKVFCPYYLICLDHQRFLRD